ncbi:ATP-binding protein [Actinoplanes sp. NPDC051513]|uniref:ATP-binding protein n=1 Tax=Actinoplanes sp. NPDC051513 TaxID=3363908 RepID=UPI0037AAC29A
MDRLPQRSRDETGSVLARHKEQSGPDEHEPAPDGWTKTFTDPRLCAAIVDRLTFGGTILETGTDSYRLAQATKQRTT